ncbi:flavin reductase [Nocardioides sp. cx-173]|uniref:flavin reductase n=1 Tax=Nocardioides sp. cx-173 TaxID=2898796 RepID=UPI001E3E4DC7|nr:flavin reductase [Nocardioides sp. cx-173]MCD4524400.1 flavin reductase [Nocardioides sp. cx-173]UGB43112.1 flavin reductase [Nocardioides sp. cx-173]
MRGGAMVDAAAFRDMLSQWPSGVTIVTTLVDGVRHGMTASSFSSVSLSPPLVSICLDRKLYTHGLIADSGVFGVSVLAKDQAELARRFAGMVPEVTDRFAGETWSTATTGVPLLDSGLGWVDCTVVHQHPGGDHTIFVGEVSAAHTARRTAPLLFHSRGWGQFADVLPDVAALSDSGLVAALAARDGDAAWVAEAAARVAATGIRVRVLDLTTGDAAAVPLPDGASGSALVADPGQARQALDLGVPTLELALADPREAAQVVERLGPLAPRTSVIVPHAFLPRCADDVLAAVHVLSGAGVLEICLDDTAGEATLLEIRATLQEAVGVARPVPLRVSLEDRDRLGLVKALTALKSGVNHFDTTLVGLDGALATEDLIRLLGTIDVHTPVDGAALGLLAEHVRRRLADRADLPARRHDLSPYPPDHVGAAG